MTRPQISRRRLVRAVVKLLIEQPQRHTRTVSALAAYIISHRLTSQFDLIMQDIADELFVQSGQLTASVEHKFDLDEATRAAIVDALKAATGARSVGLDERQEPGLIGGVIIRTPRSELDVSIRRQLKQISLGGLSL